MLQSNVWRYWKTGPVHSRPKHHDVILLQLVPRRLFPPRQSDTLEQSTVCKATRDSTVSQLCSHGHVGGHLATRALCCCRDGHLGGNAGICKPYIYIQEDDISFLWSHECIGADLSLGILAKLRLEMDGLPLYGYIVHGSGGGLCSLLARKGRDGG